MLLTKRARLLLVMLQLSQAPSIIIKSYLTSRLTSSIEQIRNSLLEITCKSLKFLLRGYKLEIRPKNRNSLIFRPVIYNKNHA
jgi:hypothetical protein